MDKLTEEQRRKNMRAIRCKDSEIERLLRSALLERDYRYRKIFPPTVWKVFQRSLEDTDNNL